MAEISYRCPNCGRAHQWVEIAETRKEGTRTIRRIIGGIGVGDFLKKFLDIDIRNDDKEWAEVKGE